MKTHTRKVKELKTKMLFLPIILSLIGLTTAAKFTSCSGIYAPQSNTSAVQPFINVTIAPSSQNLNYNYTTLIFHYKDIKKSNIPLADEFLTTDQLKICDEEQIRQRECREPGKFVVNYGESYSRIYNEVLNINQRPYLQYDVTEKGFYCVYVETLDGDEINEIDVKFQQPDGYLSLENLKIFNTLCNFQIPVTSLLLIIITARFYYVKKLKGGDVSLIQRAIFHYTYLNYLITFMNFLKLWLNNSNDVANSSWVLKFISFGFSIASFGVESLTWGLILVISHGFGTLYDRESFPKRLISKIMAFMGVNFILKLFVIDTSLSNVQELNMKMAGQALRPIISLIGFIWVVYSFYKTTKEISMYFDKTTSKLFRKSGYVIFFTPIIVSMILVTLLSLHLIKQNGISNKDVVDITEELWDIQTLEYILAIPTIGDFVTIILLLLIWDNVDSQKVDEDNLAEYGAPKHGELSLNDMRSENNSGDEATNLRP